MVSCKCPDFLRCPSIPSPQDGMGQMRAPCWFSWEREEEGLVCRGALGLSALLGFMASLVGFLTVGLQALVGHLSNLLAASTDVAHLHSALASPCNSLLSSSDQKPLCPPSSPASVHTLVGPTEPLDATTYGHGGRTLQQACPFVSPAAALHHLF